MPIKIVMGQLKLWMGMYSLLNVALKWSNLKQEFGITLELNQFRKSRFPTL